MTSFKKQVISSSKWAFLNQLVTQVIRLGVSVYMMRLLAPESFGIFMKVLSVVGISEVLVGMRLGGGIVQSQNTTKEQISTIFWITILGSIALASLFYFSAAYISLFYEDIRLEEIVKTCSYTVIFMGVGYVPRALLIKHLHFKKIFIANVIGIVISSGIGIWMALHEYDYWSLVWQWIIFNGTISMLYYSMFSKRSTIFFNIKVLSNLWNFSKNIVINDILNFTIRNIDNIIVGRMIGSSALGLYSKAYGLMLLPLQNFVNVINGVLLPALSKVQNDIKSLSSIFISAMQTISAVITPLLLFALTFEHELIYVVFGTKWLGMFTVLRVFLIMALVQSHSTLSVSIFYSTGNSKVPLKISYFSKPILIIAILIASQWGIVVLAITITTISIFFAFVQLYYAFSLIGVSAARAVSEFYLIVTIHMITIFLLILIKYFLSLYIADTPLLILSFGIMTSILILLYEIKKPKFYQDIKENIVKIV